MRQKIKALRGMLDILPDEVGYWQVVEANARALCEQCGYEEIRTPLLEETPLFKRSIGEETDIVQKQMYSFKDRGQRDISLRPEGTASIVRAYLENNLDKRSPLTKVYYIGPMYRNERPQAGRLRQFYQIGAEAIGSASPYMDAELIYLMMKILQMCGLSGSELEINSLGCRKDKKAFEQVLGKSLLKETSRLCDDCKSRYEKNLLRIFDCKNESCKTILRSAPKIADYLCGDCKKNFDDIKTALAVAGIKYSIAPFLVRGLDYYTGAVFEVVEKGLGSQDAVAAGGRYDNLIEEQGGQKTPACGFAIGIERLLMAAKGKIDLKEKRRELFLIALGSEAQKKGFKILCDLRNKGIFCELGFDGKSLKAQMRFADRMKAKKVLIIGDNELKKGIAILRDMEKKEQKEIKLENVADSHLW